MSSAEDETDSDEADGDGHGIKQYIVWFLATLLIFGGLGALLSGSGPVGVLRGILAAALMIGAGIIAIAYTTTTDHLEPIRTPLPANALMVAVIVIVLVVAGAAIGPSSDTVEDADPDAVDDGDAPTETDEPADNPDAAGDDDDGGAATTEPSGGGDDDGGGGGAATDTPNPTEPPTQTLTDTETPQPSLESYQYSGSGQRVTDSMSLEGGLVVFSMDHDGSSNFQVELIDEDTGDTEKFLANEIGQWEAEQPHYVPEGNYVLEVNADGNWNVDVEQPRPEPSEAESPPVSSTDQYPNYIGPVQFDGLHRIRGEYNGDSNFVVWVLDADGRERDLIFNEIGAFEGEGTYSGNHIGYIRVEATGDWTVEAE